MFKQKGNEETLNNNKNTKYSCKWRTLGLHFSYTKPTYYIIIDRFPIALFSALEQIHRALVACDSEGVTVFSS